MAALSDRHRCLRPDFWGCGRSPQPPDGATLEGYAAAILELLDDHAVGSVATVGLSFGGYVSMALFRLAPERIRAMVLADTRATADDATAAAARTTTAARARAEGVEFLVDSTVERLLAPGSREHAHITDPLRGRVRGCSPEGLAVQQEVMRDRPDSTALLASAGIPTLVMGGDQDPTTTPDSMRALAGSIPGAEYAVVTGAGHLSNLENPLAFNALVAGFLATAVASGAGAPPVPR